MEDALVVGLRKVDHMLVFADNLGNNSIAIPKRIVAMVDKDFERSDRLKLITGAWVVELVTTP